MTEKQGQNQPSAFSIPPIEEVDVERGPSGETDALIDKALMDGEQSIDGSLDSAGHLDEDDGKSRQRLVTTVLINLSAIMERTDEQLLPAVYRFVGASFQVIPDVHWRKYVELVGEHDSALQLDSDFREGCNSCYDIHMLYTGITKSAWLLDLVQSGGTSPGLASRRLPR